jgi:hypothetical protein
MKTIQSIVIISFFLVACSPNKTLSGSDFELLREACGSLKNQEKLKQCQVTLEKLNGDSKTTSDSKIVAKAPVPQVLFNFKDIPLGQAGAKAALIEVCKKDKSNQASEYDKRDPCDFKKERNGIWLSYGNLAHEYASIVLGKGDSLEYITINGNKVELLGLVEILQEKYGIPTKTKNSVENGMGAKFDQEIFVWVDSQGNRITVESIHSRIDKGRVLIESAARVAERTTLEKNVKEVGKLNL